MPIDPTLLTSPELRRRYAPEIQEAEAHDREVERFAREEQRALAQAEKAAQRQMKEVERQQLVAHNIAAETAFRQQGRDFFTRSDGRIVPVEDDDTWNAKQQQKQDQAQTAQRWKLEGRKFTTSPVDGSPLALESDAALAARQQQEAEKLRRDALQEQMRSLQAQEGMRTPALSQGDRSKLEKSLKKARDEAKFALTPALSQKAQAVTGGDDWVPFNKAPAPEAGAAKARLDRLTQPDADLDDDDLADLEADPVTAPHAQKLRTLRQQLAADDETRAAAEASRVKLAEMNLRMVDPARWETLQRQKLAGMEVPALEQHLASMDEELQARAADLDARAQSFQAPSQEFERAHADLTQRNEEAKKSGIPAGELVKLSDGSVWHAPLYQQLADLDARRMAAESDPARRQQRQQIQNDITEFQREQALRNDAAKTIASKQQTQARVQSDVRRFTPGMEKAAVALDAIQQDAHIRAQTLQEMYPQDGPERQAAFDALAQDIDQKRAAAEAQGMQTRAAALAAYQGVRQRLRDNDALRARAGDLFTEAAKNLAQALGITPEEADSLLEDQMNQDWSYHLPTQGEKTPDGVAEFRGDKRQFRLLNNGGLLINPAITDPVAYQQAVEASPASPEAKAAALAQQPDLRARYGAQALETLNTLNDAGWKKALADKPKDLSLEEAAARYADKLKEGTGPGERFARAIFQGLSQGVDDIGSQILGLGAGITGSETLLSGAQALNERSQLIQLDKELHGAAGGFVMDTVGQFSRLAPSLVPALGGAKAAQVGLALFGRTSVGARVLPLLSTGLRAAKTPAEAAKAAQSLLVTAGIGGAALAGGAQTYGAQIADIYTALRRDHPEMDHSTALRQAQIPALLSGAVTTLLTTLGGRSGVEKLLTAPAAAREAFKKAYSSRLAALGMGVLTGGLKELPEELADELFSTAASAHATGQSVPQAVAQFVDGLPSMAAAIFALGGLGEGIQSFRESTTDATPPAIPAVGPEVLAAAEAAIDNFTLPGLDPQSLAATQTTARTLLYIAQGDIASLPDSDLALVGVQRTEAGTLKNLKTSADGKPPRVKIENGQPIITQPTLDNLAQVLPAVRAAIPLDEVARRAANVAQASSPESVKGASRPADPTSESDKQSDTATAKNTPSAGSTPAATGVPQPSQSDTSPAISPPEAPSGAAFAEGSPEAARSQEMASHLEILGLPADQARLAGEALVRKRGIIGQSYLEHVTSPTFREDLKALGITGSLRATESQANPLKAPADLAQRAARLAAPDATPPSQERDGMPTVGPSPGAAETPAPPTKTSKEAAEPKVSRGTESSTGVPPVSGVWNTDEFLLARQTAMGKVPMPQRKRFMKFVNALDEAMTQMAAAFPAVRFTDSSKAGLNYTGAGISISYNPVHTVLEIDLAKLFANAAHIGEKDLVRFVRQAIKHELRHIAALKVIPAAEARALWGKLTPNLRNRVYASYHAADIHNAVKEAAGKPRQLTERQLLEITQAHLTGGSSDGSRPLAVSPESVALAARLRLPPADPFHMAHEFLRMLDEDAEFAGQTSEAMDADPSLGEAIVAFLKKVMDEIKRLLDTELAPEVRVQVNEMRSLVEKARKQIIADLPKRDATRKGAEPPNQNLAQTDDLRRSVVGQASAPDSVSRASPPVDFRPVLGKNGTAYTDGNDAIEYQWAVVDVNSLVISNQDDGRINPAYPQELQPRDRTSAGSEAQVADIAKNMNLDRLSATHGVGDGAPIIGEDAVVESGNGRTMGMRRAYGGRAALRGGRDSASSYRNTLISRAADFGLNAEQVEAVKNPVLVRVRRTPVDRVAFVLSANVSTIAPKREIEQAKVDAKQIVPDLFTTFVPTEDGDIFTPANAEFIRAFISAIVPPAERPGIIDARGNLTQTGLRRVRNALFVHAYGDSAETLNALARLTESIDAGGSHITNALVAAAPRFAEQNGRIAAGALYPLGITGDLAWTVQKLQDLRARGEKVADYLAQDGIPGIDDVPTGLQKELLQFLEDNKTSPRQINAALARYANAIDNAGDPKQTSLFGDEPRPTREELWKLASLPREAALAAATKVTDIPPAGRIKPEIALRLFRKLTAMKARKGGRLDSTQQQTLDRAQRSLAAHFQLDYRHPASAPFALEQESSSVVSPESPEQLRLFAATKRALYGKARDQKHLRPIIASMARLRAAVQDSLVRVVQETVVPSIPPRLREMMNRVAAEYDAWLQPRMEALRPQWEAYRARFTKEIRDQFDGTLEDIAREQRGMPMTRVPLKGARGMEKAILWGEEEGTPPDVTQVRDVMRATVVATDDEGVMRLVQAIRERFNIVSTKDRFTRPVGGYHDWLFIVEVAPGLQAEVQVHRVDYLFSKEVGPGHLMYEDWRRLAQLVRTNPDPAIAALFRRLSKAMEGYYTRIGQAFTISRNLASSMTTPSVSTSPGSAIGFTPLESGTGGSPSTSQTTGSPPTSKNLAVGGNLSGSSFTPEDTTNPPNNQGNLAKSRAVAEDVPDLFSFDFSMSNRDLGLSDLLSPEQQKQKQQQSEQLDLFTTSTPTAAPDVIPPGPTAAPSVETVSPPPTTAPAAASDYASKAQYLANSLYAELTTDDTPLTWQHLFRLADDAFGGTQADGVYTPKDAYDALEMAVNRWITERTRFDSTPVEPEIDRERADSAIKALKSFTARLPTQSKRTEETDKFQQFSTVPALAYMANWAARLSPRDIVLEPSAGTGGLAAFAKAAGARVVANELSARRASLLRATEIATQVFEENAEQIDNILPPDIRPTVVVMNPPFSTSPTGTKTTDNAIKHIESALARLPAGGRLVAIVGEGMAHDRPAFRAWWQKMQQKHHVRANIQVNGAEYAKYGTTWDNQLVVIDKVPPPTAEAGSRVTNDDGSYFTATGNEPASKPVTGRVESIDELPAMLDSIRHDRPSLRASLPGSPRGLGSTSDADSTRGARDEGRAPGSPSDAGPRGPGNSRVGMAGKSQSDQSQPPRRTDRAGVDSAPPGDAGTSGRPGRAQDSGNAAGTADDASVTPTQQEVRSTDELTDAVYDAWQPRVTFPGAKPPPTNLAESAAMAAVDPPTVSYRPSIPAAYYADPARGDFDQRLATHALESITLAGNAHQQTVQAEARSTREQEDWQKRFGSTPPTQYRRGFFIGDGTGAGKGRQIAGIMFDNWNQGRKRAVWISEPNLFPDAKRDLNDVADLGDNLFAINDTKAGEKLARSQGIGFISYSTLRSKEQKPAPGKLPKTRVDQIVEWLGADFDGVIAFDEAHNMGSAMETKGNRGNKEASQQALAGLELQQRLPNARVVYLSATGATEVSNLAYAERLGLWGPGTPFRDRSKFVSQISAGGVAAMELIAQNLKAMGLYVARSISWHDVSYDRASHSLTPEQRQIYDDLATAWQTVLNNMDAAMKVTGITVTDAETGNDKTANAAAKSAIRSKFWSGHQRFFNQLITAMKLPTVITAMERELAAGRSIVIQLVNTQASSLGRAISKAAQTAAENSEEVDLENLDLSPRDQLLQLVQNAFPVIQMEEYQTVDSEGNVRSGSRPALDSKGNPILNREAVAMRDALLDKLASTKVPSGPLEMLLDHFGAEKVAEVTGREKRVVWKKDKDGRPVRTIEKRTVEHGKREVNDFQNGERRILVFSKAGGTGRSFHADRRAKNQQKRVHILLQPGWQASAAVQGFGRTHRNNQVQPPHYLLAETDIVGEKRFMSSIARRLDQLGALTKGQRQTGSQGFFQARDNLESLEAKAALDGFYTSVLSGREPKISADVLEQQMGLKLRDKEGQPLDEKPPITQFLNRLLSLTLDLQQAVFDAFSEQLDSIIETKLSAGTLDMGLENVTALRTVENERQTVYSDPQSGAKAELVTLTLTQPTKRLSWQGLLPLAKTYDSHPWVRSKRTGKLFALTGKRNSTEKNGSVVSTFRVHGVTRSEWLSEAALEARYDFLDDKAASPVMQAEWQQQYDAAPATEDETMQVLTGTMLPIWDKIPGQPRIVRAQTEDGRRMIGRVIPDDMAEGMVSDLTGRTATLTPAKALDQVRKGQRVRLSNGWTLKSSRLSGENRVELTGPGYSDHTLLDDAGIIKERIQFNMRYFLPTGSAEAVLTDVLAKFRATLQPEGTSTLAAATKSGYTPDDEPGYQLDRRTAGMSYIHGGRVGPQQGQAIRDVHFARLASGPLREGGPFARKGFDWSPGPALAQKLSGAFGVPLLSKKQEAAIRALPLNDDGVESRVYLDRKNGVIYKRLQDWAEQPSAGMWPIVGRHYTGALDWSLQPATNPRALAVRLAVMTDLGSTPTEVAAIGPEGHIYLKQPLSPNPRLAREEAFQDTGGVAITRARAGIVEIPKAALKPGAPRAFVGAVKGRPWLILDLHAENFIGDNQDDARINDPLIGRLEGPLLSQIPGLGNAARQAQQEAYRLPDRANRLFKSSSGVSPESSPSVSSVGSVSPLAKLGWNHLDRAASAKLAALVRWTDGRTGVSQTVAKWQGHEKVRPLNEALHAIKGQFFPDAILPREVAAARREMDIKAAIGAQKAMDLVRALSGSPKFSDIAYPPEFAQNPMWRRKLYAAMTGEEPMSSLPKPLQALAKRLRETLLTIGREAVKQGRMSTDTFALLEETYMPHYYEEDVKLENSLFKRFRLGIRDILAQRTTAWHIVDLQQKDKTGEHALINWEPGKWRFRSQEHRDAFFEDFLLTQSLERLKKFGGAKTKPLTLTDLRAPAKLDAETRGRLQEILRTLRMRFQRKAPLTIAEQEKAGLIMDPVYAIARYAAQMIHDNSTAEFFNFVAAHDGRSSGVSPESSSTPQWVSDVQIQDFTEIPENARFGRLSGKFVQKDIATQILEMIETPNTALKIYDTLLGWWKAGKTVLNPGTHVRNVLGNLFFSQLAGNSVWNPGNIRYYRQAIEALRNGGHDLQEAYEQGVLGADFVSAELRQHLRALLPDPATILEDNEASPGRLMSIGKAIGQFIGGGAHKAYDKVAALYQAEDEVFKLAAYLKARAMHVAQASSPEGVAQASRLAAAHVRQWFPFFDSGSSPTLRALGRTAMPFLGFYRESIRIFGEALKHRPLALAAGLSVPSLITLFSALALGLDDDELDQVKKDMRGRAGKLFGPTPLGGLPLFSMLLPTRSASGALQQFDISAVHPFVDFMGNRVETDASEDWWQQTLRSLVAAGPLGSLLYSQMTGRDAFGDRTFVENNMTGGEKLAARLDNAAKTLLPPLAPGGTGFATLMNAGDRSTNKTLEVRDPAQAVARAVVGLDVRNATPNLYRIADDWRKANGLETTEGMDFSGSTPASRARKALFAQLAQDEPNQTAIANLRKRLKELGSPVETEQQVNRFLFFRNPLMVIKGAENQQRFRASLTGLELETLLAAEAEFARIKTRASMYLR